MNAINQSVCCPNTNNIQTTPLKGIIKEYFLQTMDVTVYQRLFGYQNSSKYILVSTKNNQNSFRFGTT